MLVLRRRVITEYFDADITSRWELVLAYCVNAGAIVVHLVDFLIQEREQAALHVQLEAAAREAELDRTRTAVRSPLFVCGHWLCEGSCCCCLIFVAILTVRAIYVFFKSRSGRKRFVPNKNWSVLKQQLYVPLSVVGSMTSCISINIGSVAYKQ